MELHLSGDVAVVTGAASGIGLATARTLLDEGCRVEMWDRSEEVAAVAESLEGEFPDCVASQQLDIVDEEAVREAAETARARWDTFHHLIHAAAIGSGKFGFPFTNLEPRDWRKVLEVNVIGTVNVVHACEPVLRAAARGSIVLIGSIAGQIGSQTDPPYSASKAANLNFMQCLAKDLASANIRVNMVNPGMVQTPLNRSVWQAWHDQQQGEDRLDYEIWAARKIDQVTPLGRWQTPEDVAAMVVFLCSGRARNITGQSMNVDGGCVMHW